VCKVDKTKCPVKAAWTASSAVSPSLISPTMIIFGSCLRKALKADAKVRPAWGLTCTWFTPGTLISTGSSIVTMLTLIVFSFPKVDAKVTVFPEEVGPVTSIIPLGFSVISSYLFRVSPLIPRSP